MQIPSKRWVVAPAPPPEVQLALERLPLVLRHVVHNRGFHNYEDARQYLEARLPPGCEPLNMAGIAPAVERICQAIQDGEPVAVYGDYDVDGVSATALLTQALEAFGARVTGYIPNRFDEGYGVNNDALDTLRQQGIRLVITVDCGIRSPLEAAYAKDLGLDLIITDHHHPSSEMPDCVAVINPKQPACSYPDKDLAGVGLAYKLVEALSEHPSLQTAERPVRPADYLDLVSLGTVADLAPLRGENRFLVRQGLRLINATRRQGLMSLIGVSGLAANRITATEIGFALGPRLNAAGRLDSAQAALELLTARDPKVTAMLAQKLEIQNRERQQITRDIQAKAEELALAADPEALLLFAVHPDFNSGVVGLAASRLTERYYRPAIVAQQGEVFTRGSCRSIRDLHITAALDQCADLLEHYGGHAAAAGFTVRNENLPELRRRLGEWVAQQLAGVDLRPVLEADLEIPLSELQVEMIDDLRWLQPTGHQNPQAAFVSRGAEVVRSQTVGHDSAHLKLKLGEGTAFFDAIAFRLGHLYETLPQYVDILYTFEWNEFNGRSTPQLNIRDLKPAGSLG